MAVITQKKTLSKMHVRMFVMLIIVIAGFGFLVYQLFQLQIVEGESYQNRAVQQQTRSQTIGAKRGTIYDTNNKVLAQSATVWNICIEPRLMDETRLVKISQDLSVILDVPAEQIFALASRRNSAYERIKRRVERPLVDEVIAYAQREKVKGINYEEDTKRYYTYGSLASTLLGFTGYDNEGAYGLESYYETTLSGKPGMVIASKDGRGGDMPFKHQQMYAPQNGNSIVLTIDETIQHFLERHLQTAIVEHHIENKAAGIVMDVNTGAIVAMATMPDYNPNEPSVLIDPNLIAQMEALPPTLTDVEREDAVKDLWYTQWTNKAISEAYEPGSVFKIITAAAALDNKVVSLHDEFYCPGYIEVGDRTISCSRQQGHGQQDFFRGMQNSCNPVFITVGQRVGARTMYNYLENFGLLNTTGVDLPLEGVGGNHSLQTLSKESMVELSSLSFGQSFTVTPLQLITAVSAAVNGGRLMQPYILKQVLDEEGNVLQTTQPVVKRQVISEETSAVIRQLVEGVVEDGSGRLSSIPGYRIGGKTGTSEKLSKMRTEGVMKHILSFVGFFPMENPRYAVLVMLDEPEVENAFGSTIAAPVVGAIINDMVQYLHMEPHYTEEQLLEREVDVPELLGKKPHDAQAELRRRGLESRLVGQGTEVLRQIPQAWKKMAKGGTVILYTDEETLDSNIEIPDVVGLSALEANKTLTEAGLNIQLRGVTNDGVPTIVSQQWPLAGDIAATGDIVIITLEHKPKDG